MLNKPNTTPSVLLLPAPGESAFPGNKIPERDIFEDLDLILQEDPVFYIEDVLGDELVDYQETVVEAVRDNAVVAVRSCHAIGKSFISSRILVTFLQTHPMSVAWSTAPTGRQVYNILWREINACVKGAKFPLGGEILKQRYELDDKWFGFGFATDTPEAFQGIHAESGDILGIIDEGSGVADQIFQASEATLTSANAKLLVVGNANKRTGAFYKMFSTPGVKKIKITCFDTPNFKINGIKNTDDLIKFAEEKGIENAEISHPYLITPQWVYRILLSYGRTSTNYRVRCLAEFPTSDEDTLITIDMIEGAFHREVTPEEDDEEVIACDPARFGSDRTAILERKGFKVSNKKTFQGQRTTRISGYLIARKRENPRLVVKIDPIGIGAGVVDEVMEVAEEEGWEEDVIEVNYAENAIEEKKYENHRTELWFLLKDFLPEADLPNDDDFLEGAEVKYEYTSKGKNRLEKKENTKKRIGKSPDVMDALAISLSNKSMKKEPNIRVL